MSTIRGEALGGLREGEGGAGDASVGHPARDGVGPSKFLMSYVFFAKAQGAIWFLIFYVLCQFEAVSGAMWVEMRIEVFEGRGVGKD